MRHYSLGSVADELSNCQESSYSKPVIFVMANDGNSSTAVSWCRGNKLKIFAFLMLALLMVQYLFGASIYNIRIFDYNIAQIYVWSGDRNSNDPSRSPLSSNTVTTFSTVSDSTAERDSTFPAHSDSIFSTSTPFLTTAGAILTTGFNNATNSSIVVSEEKIPNSSNNPPTTSSTLASIPLLNSSFCPLLPPNLVGPIKVWFDYPSYEKLEKLYPDLEPGGHGKPKKCISRHRVAIIIPYRDRDIHLRGFLHNIHSLLQKQQLDYAIYIVEQVANQTFNRAKLMNVGFVESMKQYDWQCAIFHDVDLLPEDDRNIYSCPEQPRHMSVAVDKFAYRLPYKELFGGISALTSDQFLKLNGFSNDYWGWGGEDDDFSSRVKLHKFQISRYPVNIARYKMIKHISDKQNPVNACRYNLMYKVQRRWMKDGLSNLNYKVVSLEKRRLFTRVLVDLMETESRRSLAAEGICASQPKKG